MPTWEGIEDASSTPTCIWLSREKDEDEWKPLRKVDCRALNESGGVNEVYIDGGRATADPINGCIRYNFYNAPRRQLTSATWFVKEDKKGSKKEFILQPVSVLDRELMEDLYQHAVEAVSPLGKGVDSVLKEHYVLQDDADYQIMVTKNVVTNVLGMVKKQTGWFGKEYELQRGWGEYVVEGEEEELALGPVRHLIFAIHGIGEAMWSRNDVNVCSIVNEMSRTRAIVHKKQVMEWKKQCEKAKKAGEPEPSPPDRIELLPIEWYDRIHSSSNSIMKSLKATTLRSIPALRAIANDVVFDVLMYLTPSFCDTVLECVTTQIDDLFTGFQRVHPDFVASGGKCSLIGHSLGSVICWDLLSILKDGKRSDSADGAMNPPPMNPSYTGDASAATVGYQAYATKDELSNTADHGSYGPALVKPMKECIPFVPDFTLFLGSPIGLFLTLRGAHAVFDEIREKSAAAAAQKEVMEQSSDQQEEDYVKVTSDVAVEEPSIASPFSLPSGSIYNIFHPSDPVAYRIEPLLLPQDFDDSDLPPPVYVVKQGQSVRLHVKAMQFGDDLRRQFAEKTMSFSSIVSHVAEQATTALNGEAAVDVDDNEKQKKSPTSQWSSGPIKFALGGKADRVDYQLQPGVIDNEYLSAVSAHSSYFSNTDLLEFIIDLAGAKKNDIIQSDGSVEK